MTGSLNDDMAHLQERPPLVLKMSASLGRCVQAPPTLVRCCSAPPKISPDRYKCQWNFRNVVFLFSYLFLFLFLFLFSSGRMHARGKVRTVGRATVPRVPSLQRPPGVTGAARPLYPTSATRHFFNLGWPFSENASAAEAGKAIEYKDERVLPCVALLHPSNQNTFIFNIYFTIFKQLNRYSADEVFDVVSDVAKYQDFLPWCTHSRVLFKTPTRMDAELGTTPTTNTKQCHCHMLCTHSPYAAFLLCCAMQG